MTQKIITHYIQKHILAALEAEPVIRFRDLKLDDVDTNLLSYHLGLLVKRDLIAKVDGGYSLGSEGLAYYGKAASVVSSNQISVQVMLVVQNSEGDILMQQQSTGKWSLPRTGLKVSDVSIQTAANNLVQGSLGADFQPEHAGECYVRVGSGQKVDSSTLAHVFRHYSDDITETNTIKWMRPHKLSQVELEPAVEDIMTRTFFRDPYFFEEYNN